MNFKEIIEAWIISHNPSDTQKELAEERYKVCDDCLSKKVKLKIEYCDECGCPIGKKIFTNNYNTCPLFKWEEVDKPYFSIRKDNKTFL